MKLCIFLLLTFITTGVFSQQSVYYQKAAKLYKDAAAKTKCPSTRGKVLIEYAEWNERMVLVLAGTLSTAGPQPTTPVPPCDSDMIGEGGSNSNAMQNINTNSSVTSPVTSNSTETVNAVVGAAGDLFSMIQADKQKKEDNWNNLSPEEQQAVIQAKKTADSLKYANKVKNNREEENAISNHPFSIGVYGAIENRNFIADNISEFYNKDGYSTSIPILSEVKKSTGYNVGLNFEWALNSWGIGDKTRRSLFNVGMYYVTYSAPMVINQNIDTSMRFDGNVAMFKFQSMRIAPTLSFRLIRIGRPKEMSGVFFQWGLKADYMFSAIAKPVTFNNETTAMYHSILSTYKLDDHFKKLEWGMICGIRVDLSRHFFFNLQYDILGGLNDKILKSKYAEDSEYYTFQNKHKITAGIGIYF